MPHLGLDSCFQCDGGAGVCGWFFPLFDSWFRAQILNQPLASLMTLDFGVTSQPHFPQTASPPANCGQQLLISMHIAFADYEVSVCSLQ